jgi:hypothetical protein
MTHYDIEAYLTNHGWVSRVTRLDRFGVDEAIFTAGLGLENETEEDALRRGTRWVLSQGGDVRRTRERSTPS